MLSSNVHQCIRTMNCFAGNMYRLRVPSVVGCWGPENVCWIVSHGIIPLLAMDSSEIVFQNDHSDRSRPLVPAFAVQICDKTEKLGENTCFFLTVRKVWRDGWPFPQNNISFSSHFIFADRPWWRWWRWKRDKTLDGRFSRAGPKTPSWDRRKPARCHCKYRKWENFYPGSFKRFRIEVIVTSSRKLERMDAMLSQLQNDFISSELTTVTALHGQQALTGE